MGSLKILLLIILIPGLALGQDIKSTFFSRCEKFKEYDCQKLWDAFEQAYVNKNSRNVSVEAYDRLIAAIHFIPPQHNKAMLWSRTEKLVHNLRHCRPECFEPYVKTSLRSILDGLTWCGKEGKNDTFAMTREQKEKSNNPCDGVCDIESAKYAEAASGAVTAMLTGYNYRPFKKSSVFNCVEVPRLESPRVTSLNVVMVRRKIAIGRSNCNHKYLKKLNETMRDKDITYTCKEVPESQIERCIKNKTIACNDCFSGSWVVRPSFLSFIVLCFSFMF